MHECDWLEALIGAADHWSKELREDPDCEEALRSLSKAIKGIHHLSGIVDSKILDKYRETKRF